MNRQEIVKVLSVASLCVFLVLGSYAQSPVDTIIEDYMTKYQVPGLAVGIVQKDKVLKWDAYGMADIQNGALVQKNTSFELGSLTKQFTAAAILKLAQDQKLTLDDYVHQHFPECPKHWKQIKIKHLIWHTSGLPGLYPHDSYTQPSFTGYQKMDATILDKMMQTNRVSKELAIQSILTDSLDFEPGTKYNYSDVGYLVLGIVIDNITGSYGQYLENAIFKPFDLDNTYLLAQEKVVLHQARGYSLKNGEWVNIMRTWDYEIPSFFGVFSTVEDMLKWNKVIDSNRFLDETYRQLFFSNGILTDGTAINYAAGWEVDNINGIQFIKHDGITGTRMVKVPSEDFCLVILTNLGYNGNDFIDPWSLSNELLNYYGIETQINKNHITKEGHKVMDYKRKSHRAIEGHYSTNEGLQAWVFWEEDVFIFESQGGKKEMALLDNGRWLVLGLEYEYILDFDIDKGTLTSNYGRVFEKVDE